MTNHSRSSKKKTKVKVNPAAKKAVNRTVRKKK